MNGLRARRRVVACAVPAAVLAWLGCRTTGPERAALPAREPSLWRSDEVMPAGAPDDPMLARIRALAARAGGPAAPPQEAPRSTAADVPSPAGARGIAGLGLPGFDMLPDLQGATGIAAPAPAPPTPAAPAGTPAAPAAPALEAPGPAAALALDAGDELDIVVGGQPEFSGRVRVRDDGTLALPTTADLVKARGLTTRQLSTAVAGAICPRYAKRMPDVSVVLVASPRMAYYVFGAVRTPGRYQMPPAGATVLDAVLRASATDPAGAAAVGFEPVKGARYDRVHVFEPGGRARVVDAGLAMRGGRGRDERLSPGEVVVVPASAGEWSEEELRRRLAREPGAPGTKEGAP